MHVSVDVYECIRAHTNDLTQLMLSFYILLLLHILLFLLSLVLYWVCSVYKHSYVCIGIACVCIYIIL